MDDGVSNIAIGREAMESSTAGGNELLTTLPLGIEL